eukprot:TRINITY_DN23210_c0_g1_i1.p1 TRINITY_DN23210_c0_g1~~TRINITY_DN23210_c0_g1_i1.p1  ORF type:complete len:342 (-),score=56.30 TRINITY_DN23210_c0_g1_i1:82-1107(-)
MVASVLWSLALIAIHLRHAEATEQAACGHQQGLAFSKSDSCMTAACGAEVDVAAVELLQMDLGVDQNGTQKEPAPGSETFWESIFRALTGNATNSSAKRATKEADCHMLNSKYVPLDMVGQERSETPSAIACQNRCASVRSCAHFTWLPDGGCHIQDSRASLVAEIGPAAGPRSCQIGNESQAAAASSATGAVIVSTPSAFYTAINSAVVPRVCNVPVGTKAPESCCTGTWFAGNFSSDTCSTLPMPGDDSEWIRNYFGCENGVPTYAEACLPDGLVLGRDFPFPKIHASTFIANGNSTTCNCAAGGALPTIYRGPGCWRAATLSTSLVWYFLKFDGKCLA